jgi:hypothetical protein
MHPVARVSMSTDICCVRRFLHILVIFIVLSVSMFCSQDPEKSEAQMYSCKDFSIITLNDNSVHDISSKVQRSGLFEIGFTIIYR